VLEFDSLGMNARRILELELCSRVTPEVMKVWLFSIEVVGILYQRWRWVKITRTLQCPS
jgi:hypothetical protein